MITTADFLTFVSAGFHGGDDYRIPDDAWLSPTPTDYETWCQNRYYLAEPIPSGGYTLADDDGYVVAVADDAVGVVDAWRALTGTRRSFLSGASALRMIADAGFVPAQVGNAPDAVAFRNADNTVLVSLAWGSVWCRSVAPAGGNGDAVSVLTDLRSALAG